MTKFLFIGTLLLSAFTLTAQKTELHKTRYFVFHSNPQLNAHLFLYSKAMTCKFRKIPNDSLVYCAFSDKIKLIPASDLHTLNDLVLYYKDSLMSKDLLFDSLMRDFSDQLIKPAFTPKAWQINALEKVTAFLPHFNKLYWKNIDAANKAWILANKKNIERLEAIIVPALEAIYETKLPDSKVIVDLSCYATWAGAYSFSDSFCHVIFAPGHTSNKGDLGLETVFHETSHFLVDKLNKLINERVKNISPKPTFSFNLWHNMLFYTTGEIMTKQFAAEGKNYTPYYKQMKFEDKFPDFKKTVEYCKQYWDPHIAGTVSMQNAANEIADAFMR